MAAFNQHQQGNIPKLTNVTSRKGHDQLLRFGALTAGLRDNILVEHLHSSLKAGKLHHGVGDLPHPQGSHSFIETGITGKKQGMSSETLGTRTSYRDKYPLILK